MAGYHHGDLRRALIDEAVRAIEESGPRGVSLRELARRSGVSHAAPAHHFGDLRGLLTAVATEGFELLAEALDTDDFLEVAVRYVRFARERRGYFATMFDPTLVDRENEALRAARERAGTRLREGAATHADPLRPDDPEAARTAAFALVHGLAMLGSSGALEIPEPDEMTRRVAQQLFPAVPSYLKMRDVPGEKHPSNWQVAPPNIPQNGGSLGV